MSHISIGCSKEKQGEKRGVSQISLHSIQPTQAGRYDCVSFTRLDSVTSRPGYIRVNSKMKQTYSKVPIPLSMPTHISNYRENRTFLES